MRKIPYPAPGEGTFKFPSGAAMTRLILRNPLAALVSVLILCLLGAVSVFRIPVQMIPDISPRRIMVETNWPGATPQDVEQEILIGQEKYLRAIPGLVRLSSSAEFGGGQVEPEFPSGASIDEALIHIDNALSQVADYPETVDRPRVVAESATAEPFLFYGVGRLDGATDAESIQRETNWIENVLRPRLERVPGVAKAEVIGGATQKIHILLDPLKLSARHLNVGTVRDAIRARNRDVSGGDRDFGKRRYFLRTIGRFSDLEDLAELIVARENGTAIRLRDVGSVTMATKEARSMAFADGRPTLLVTIGKRAGANVIAVKDAVTEAVEELNRHALKERGLTMRLLSEDVRYMERSIDNVLNNLIAGSALAAVVVLLFLRSVPATAAAASMPVCTLATLLVLAASGRSINVISLSGVAFAIGMTLDNSVVALDSIARHLRMGKSRAAATEDGIAEVWPAILSSTLTTVLVFLPVLFITAEAGQLYSDIAIAITGAVMMSMLASAKDRTEHRYVVDAVRAALAGHCSHLSVPDVPSVIRTPTMLHLSTELTGELADPTVSSLRLAHALHPTPAVCGTPTDLARDAIARLEGYARNWYSGMVGWMDSRGNGEWALSIRCGLVQGRRLRLYAGAGVVADSDPAAEWEETAAKLTTMLNLFGVGAALPSDANVPVGLAPVGLAS